MKSAFKAQALLFTMLAFFVCSTLSADPDPLQDYCIADVNAVPGINGYPCKNSSAATSNDFFYSGLINSGSTANIYKFGRVLASANTFPGLNTQGLSIARLDLLPGGIVPPHTHPRASEVVYIEQGTAYAAFVTEDNRLFGKVMVRGEIMIIPRGLIHWQMNVGNTRVKIIAVLNSQSPGFPIIAENMFAAQPQVPYDVVQKSFFINQSIYDEIRGKLVPH